SGGQQGLDLVAAEGLGQAAALFGRIQAAGGIVGAPTLAQGETIELAYGGAASRGRGGGQSASRWIGEPGLKSFLRRAHQAAGVAQPGLCVRQIATIGGQRMGRGVALHRHHLQEGFDLRGHAASGRLFWPIVACGMWSRAASGVEGIRTMPSDASPDSFPLSSVRTIALVGLMGVGKSTVGRRLAARLGLPFADGDQVIEEAAGMTVNEIFATRGEAEFRAGEARVMKRLLEGPPIVLATGGGALLNADTRALMKQHAVSVWMRADLKVIAERVGRRDTRPLLRNRDPLTALNDLAKARYPIYGEADLTVDVG